MKLSSYPKIWNLGHPQAADLLQDPVIVEEKVDGSQFSFGFIDGALHFRSRQAEIVPDSAGMFDAGCRALSDLHAAVGLTPGWVYRGEYLAKPKHNVLAYDRVPRRHVILFDVMTGPETYLDDLAKYKEAERLGLDIVPLLYGGLLHKVEQLYDLLERVSVLGGQKIEGVVIKNYARYGRDGKTLMGKHVSEAFKEVHKKDWKDRNPGGKDILELIGQRYRSEARWEKAVQHRRELELLENAPQDIGPLMKEVVQDVEEECVDEIKAQLWAWAWPQIKRKVNAGLPQWYKDKLAAQQFEEKP